LIEFEYDAALLTLEEMRSFSMNTSQSTYDAGLLN